MNPFQEIVEKLQDPDNMLSTQQRDQVRNLTGSVDNFVKASLINLLMGQFTKISAYESAIQQIVQELSRKAPSMDTDELIAFLTTLAKVNASETKTTLDLFKKNDNDVKQFIKEIQKITKERPAGRDDTEDIIDDSTVESIELTPEKKEKAMRLLSAIQDANKQDS